MIIAMKTYALQNKKRFAWKKRLTKKNNVIRNIEIAVAVVVALIAGVGIYGIM